MTILHLTARSYGDARAPERHPYAQFVLPVSGCLDLEIAGHGGRLAMGSAAFVAAGTDHAQAATSRNRFLILDMDMALVGDAAADMLARRRFLPLSPQARHLIDFMRLHLDGGARP
ncbi:AraC family transcriptional regulator, partial [Nguyenibacter vanlangensis]|nr:AraC family transcriptional regulator [Nguyenibacter vanlangensis]